MRAPSTERNAQVPVVPKRSLRLWPAVVILTLTAGSIVAAWSWPETLKQNRVLGTQFSLVVCGVLLVLWMLLLSRLRWKTRLAILGILVAGGLGFAGALRRVVFTGDLWLRFVWRWAPEADLAGAAAALRDTPRNDRARIDFTDVSKDDYPQFLGPDRNAVVHGAGLLRDWAAHPPRELWRQPIGAGWSSFAVVGGYAVTQEQRDGKELVTCYEVRTGRLCWVHTDDTMFHHPMGGDGPRATPTIAGGKVYTLGATGRLNCLDGATGASVWAVDTLRDNATQNSEWGKSGSPLVVDDLVIVSAGGKNGHSLVAYDKDTGARVWAGGDRRSGYASPLLTTLAGVRQILILNDGALTAHDPTDGHVLWEQAWGKHINVAQPVPLDGDKVFVSAGYNVGCAMFQVAHRESGAFEITERWRSRSIKAKFTNVVVHEGFLYGLDDGIFVCVDLATGKRRWKAGRYGHGQVLGLDDLLLVQAESGDVVLVEANPDAHREHGRLPALGSKTWNNPAFWRGYLLVRNDQEAACYRLASRFDQDDGVAARTLE